MFAPEEGLSLSFVQPPQAFLAEGDKELEAALLKVDEQAELEEEAAEEDEE